jgi:hypothetical protein
MRRKIAKISPWVSLMCGLFTFLWITGAKATHRVQIPTGSVPTVTGSPSGAIVIVLNNEQGFANVRSGPGTLGYEIVGVMVEGQQAPALGRTIVGDWIMIAYPGVEGGVAWVWKDLVEVRGDVPIIEAPATSTPRVTPTIDPTLAAQYLVDVPPTRLPTFTAPAPVSVPTFLPDSSQGTTGGGIPIGFLITGLAVLGIFGLLISFLRGR